MAWLKICSLISLGKWIPHTEIMKAKARCQSATLSASDVFTEPPLLGARGQGRITEVSRDLEKLQTGRDIAGHLVESPTQKRKLLDHNPAVHAFCPGTLSLPRQPVAIFGSHRG